MIKFIPFAALLFFVSSISFSQTVEEIVNKHITAIGGKEKLLTLNSLIMEGTLNVMGSDVNVKIFQANNKGSRFELEVMGMTGYVITTQTEGWTYFPFQGQTTPEAMPADLVKEGADLLDLQGVLLNYGEKGHKLEYIGKEDFEGTECFKIKANLKGGSEITMFFDPANYYILKQVSKSKAGGREMDQVQTFSNFKKTDEGFVFPYAMTGFGPGEISYSKIEVNKQVDDSRFKKSD